VNATGPVPLVLDVHLPHECWVISTDPHLNDKLHHPTDKDKSLNEEDADNIRKYRLDCNNNPPQSVSFRTGIPSTSGRLHSEFFRNLFLQDHRETDHFLHLQEFSSCNMTVDSSTSTV
jgi:hypothetical protein